MNAVKEIAACVCCMLAVSTFAAGCRPSAGDKTASKPAATAAAKTPSAAAVFSNGWTEDYKGAVKVATEKNVPLFLDFTGSDWCGWCMLMDRQVFEKTEWKKWAADNLVCVKLDFPQSVKQAAALKEQNEGLMRRFGIRGFPTFVLLSPDGEKKLGQFGCPGRDVKASQFVDLVKKTIGK